MDQRIWNRVVPGLAGVVVAALFFASTIPASAQEDRKKDRQAHQDRSGQSGSQAKPAARPENPQRDSRAADSSTPRGNQRDASSSESHRQGGPQQSQGSAPAERNHGGSPADAGRRYGQQGGNTPAERNGGSNPADAGHRYGQQGGNTPAERNGGSNPADAGHRYGQQGGNAPAERNGGTPSDAGRRFGQQNPNQQGQRHDVNPGEHRPPANYEGRTPTEFHGRNGASARFDHSGRPAVVRTHDTTIIHVPGGARRVEVVRPGGRVIIANARGYGYVQRPVVVRGHDFYQRSYYVNGRTYSRVYRPWAYGGITYQVYTPVRYYHPRFYLWAYTPWRSPIYYRWSWANEPWYASYSWYFRPYPTYSSPSLWLTDFLFAATLRESYEERMEANYNNSLYGNVVGLTPAVKQMVAEEVQRQLALEREESELASRNMMPVSSGAPPILSGRSRVFVVSAGLMTNANGQDCSLAPGDVLQLSQTPSSDPNFLYVQVLASNPQDCRAGYLVPVQLADLQEMNNHMRAMIDQGIGDLQSQQGQGGLPPIEASLRTETPAPYAAEVPPAENVSGEIQQQVQYADQQEKQVLDQAASSDGASAAPPTIRLGQSVSEVVQLIGNPGKIIDLGQTKTYVYSDMKVVFTDGRVTDVQ
jgi:hypothetical protein